MLSDITQVIQIDFQFIGCELPMVHRKEQLIASMHEHNTTTKVLFELVKESSNPAQYSCLLSEIIAHHDQAWDDVIADLPTLSEDELIVYITPVAIKITQKGLCLAQAIDQLNSDISFKPFEKVA